MGDRRICQTFAASPAEPGGLPLMLGTLNRGPIMGFQILRLRRCKAQSRHLARLTRNGFLRIAPTLLPAGSVHVINRLLPLAEAVTVGPCLS